MKSNQASAPSEKKPRTRHPNPLDQPTGKRVNLKGLERVTNIPARTLRGLFHQKKIPGIKLGFRTLIFDPAKVLAALDKYEVKAVA